jgi:DNA-binding PadR family transcriptional regulator
MSPLDYHVLLALSPAPLHGYAIKKLVADESGGTQMPRAGTLYRVIARLVTSGLVREAAPADRDPHPGRERRYYALTPAGRRALAVEAQRLKQTAAIAERRLRQETGRS